MEANERQNQEDTTTLLTSQKELHIVKARVSTLNTFTIPEFEKQKQAVAAVRNFKEASRIQKEIKQAQEQVLADEAENQTLQATVSARRRGELTKRLMKCLQVWRNAS